MISAVFRRGGDVTFVVEELKAIFDPQGGQWMNGHYVPSLLAAIGAIIERHMLRIGFIPRPLGTLPERVEDGSLRRDQLPAPRRGGTDPGGEGAARNAGAAHAGPMGLEGGSPAGTAAIGAPSARVRRCPRCQAGALTMHGGCWVCLDCGYSKCG